MKKLAIIWISTIVVLSRLYEVQGECIQDGIRYKNSSLWRKDSCTECKCINKVIICHKEICKDPSCDATKGESLVIRPNACCPTCTTERGKPCSDGEKVIAHNTQWEGKNCSYYECTNGAIITTPVACEEDLQCGYGEIAWKRPGECCEKCVSTGASCEYNGNTYRDGDVWKPTKCERAKCSNGEIIFQIAKCDPVVCPPGQELTLLTDQCCPQCIGAACSFEGKRYKTGDHFKSSPCKHCSCNNGHITCRNTSCGDINDEFDQLVCDSGEVDTTREGHCCPECLPSEGFCEHEGVRRYHGDMWNSSNCEMFSCIRGTVKSYPLQCSHVTCGVHETLVHNEGSCCPECVAASSRCSHNGLSYRHGDEWQTTPCERCACLHGTTQCFTADCEPCPDNTVSVKVQGECCPTCEPVTCHPDCATCNGPNYGQCLTCKNPRDLLQDGKCLRRCLPGFYQEGRECKRCHSSCVKCTLANSPNTCTSCKSPQLLQDGSCVDECIDGYYDRDGVCQRCARGCAECIGAGECVECSNKTMLVQDGRCVSECGRDFFYANAVCRPCHVSCASCSSSATVCDSCPPGKLMQRHLCVSECSDKFYQTEERTCKACHVSCGSCNGSAVSQCLSCTNGKVLLDGKCIAKCPAGHFAEDGICKVCHGNCQLCVGPSASNCTVCSRRSHVIQPQNDRFQTGSCMERCDEGFYSENNLCKRCHESCANCDGPSNTNCTSCTDQSYLLMTSHMSSLLKRMCLSSDECWAFSLTADDASHQCFDKEKLRDCNALEKSLVLTLHASDAEKIERCVATCPKGSYKEVTAFGSMCIPCTSGCASCDSDDRCIDCEDGKVVSAITARCVNKCEDGFYNSRGQCTPCPSSCITCEIHQNGGNRPRCTSCRDTGKVLQFGECIAKCPEQFYPDTTESVAGTPVCKECDWSCKTCWGPSASHCVECLPGSSLQKGRCVKICTSGFYEQNATCTPCQIQHCTSCEEGESCLSCNPPYILHDGKCVSSCPRRFIHDSVTNRCTPCPNHCLECFSATDCKQCDGASFLEASTNSSFPKSTRCVTKCNDGYFGNELTRLCQANHESPSVHVSGNLIVTIGGRSMIDDKVLRITDKDSKPEQLYLMIEREPEIGEMQLDKVRVRVGESVPVEKVHQGRLWFIHDAHHGRQPGRVRLQVTDGHLMSHSRQINILPVSSHSPKVTKNKPLVVSAGKSTKITSETLNIVDKDNPRDVIIRIVSTAKFGYITSSQSSGRKITSFILEDLTEGNLKYVTSREGGTETLNDVINLQVTDQYHVINVALRVEIVPQTTGMASLIINKMSRVRSGGLLHITSELLRIVAGARSSKAKLVYVLKSSNITSGEVIKLTSMASDDPNTVSDEWTRMEASIWKSPPLSKFTQEEVDEGDIWWRDTEGMGEEDAFEFQIYDENFRPPRHVDDDVFRVSVIPENNAKPHVARGVTYPPQMTADDRSVSVINNGYIRYTDEDTPDRDLIYNITKSIPSSFGTIEHADNPSVPITLFTQSEIDSDKIIFRPLDGSFLPTYEGDLTGEIITDDYDPGIIEENLYEYGETEHDAEFRETLRVMPMSAQFEYTVSDGVHTLSPSTFTITLTDPTETVGPTFTNPNPTIDVTQGGAAPIGTTQLAVTDPDTDSGNLIFTLVKQPRYGHVLRNDRGMRVIVREGDSFTYDEIQRNALQYVHDGSGGSLHDQIQVSVTDVTHTDTKVIQISILKTGRTGPRPDSITELSLTLTEGSTEVLKRENLAYVDADSNAHQITYHIETEPIHGILVNGRQDIVAEDTFTQQDINAGRISYQSAENIGSEPLTDTVRFTVIDHAGNKLSNQLLTITVTPANSQPPTVIISSGIKVEEGGTVLVTPLNIMARDADTPKQDIIITITMKPLFGYFWNTQNPESQEEEVHFSMQDILDGSIYYYQSLHQYFEPRADHFRFRVSDGHKTSPIYRINVTITPSNDEEPDVQTNTLLCKSGHATMILNASLLVADRDTESTDLVFTLTTVPETGSLVKFTREASDDVMRKLKETGNGSLQLEMMHKREMVKLRVGSTFTYQDILDELICYESEGFVSHPAALHRRRRSALGFILSDGKSRTEGSINIDVEPDNSATASLTESEETDPIIREEVIPTKTMLVPEIRVNTGITVEKGTSTAITRSNLLAVDTEDVDLRRFPAYVIMIDPSVGYLQLRNPTFVRNLTTSGDSEFYQQDIDDGWLHYVHPAEARGGRFHFKFNVVGASGSTLQEQNFMINVKEDKKPPVIRVNEVIVVQEGSSQKITAEQLSATDDVGPEQLVYTILVEPNHGQVELVKKPGEKIQSFTQLQVNGGRIQYVPSSNEKESISDGFTFSLSDGTNKVIQEFVITVHPVDNSLPVLENHGIRVQEGVRKIITEFELKATDVDTNDKLVTFTIIQQPAHGSIEKTNHRGRYIPVTGFSMADIYQSLISYNHDGSNEVEDRFVFLVQDGTNKEFVITEEGEQITTTASQVFHITVLPVDDGAPKIVINQGLHHLEYMDNKAMGIITKKNLFTEDPDTAADRITYTITSDPRHGHVESNTEPGVPLKSFTQNDINSGVIRYVLADASIDETMDSFMFNVRDSLPTAVTGNLFYIRWSVFSLDKRNYTVKEGDGQIEVLVRRHGNLNYAIVLCSTQAGTATDLDSTEPGLLDYVKHAGQVQFDEHEDEKVCTIEIKDDQVYEGEEKFKVKLAMPNYALLGSITETTVTIDDTEDKPTMQFDETEKVVQENDVSFFLTVRRTGDIQKKVTVVCLTESGTATGSSESGRLGSGSDYKSRDRTSEQSIVVFEPGVSTASCDVTLIDDSKYEEDESFVVMLSDPSTGSQVGEQSEVKVTISGPNDAPSVFFSDSHYEFSENQETVDVTVIRAGSDLSQSTDVWCATRAMNPVSAIPGEDFVQSSNKVTFRNGETSKICTMTILDDSQSPSVEGNETFEVYLTSVLRAKLVSPHHAIVTINDTMDDIPTMQFLETSAEVKEKDRYIALAIHREGDISSPSSVICYTRRDTADVDDDFVERARTELSRVLFSAGQKIAYCNVSIVDDNLHESEERFSVRLGNAVGSRWYGAQVGDNKIVEITITNKEDAPTIQFERAEFSIREPDTGEPHRELVVKILRTGDVTEVSKVRCSTRDGSATSGRDYEPKSMLLRFNPGDTEVTFTVNILPNDDTEWHETFLLVLGPDDPVNAELGPISQATVTVLDKDAAGSLILPTTPVVVSLLHYDEVKTGMDTDPPPGYPLVCVTPCDPRYPEYADTRNLCEEAGINATAIKFSWEVAMPSNFDGGGNHPFEKVLDATPFTSVNTKVLDSIYFSRRFHVRCVAQAADSATGTGGTPLRSNVATIATDSGLCHNPIVSGSERGFQAQSFIAKLDYITPGSDEHADSVKISVEIPHQDGRLPLISTMPFHNLKLLLSRAIDRQQHLCSNMMYSSKTIHINPTDLEVAEEDKDHELGEYLGFIEPTDYSKLSLGPGFDKPFQLDPTVREAKSIDLYKYLNLKSCVWKFTAYYKMGQLINFCNGKVDRDYQARDSLKSLVTVTVPLHVSYVYVRAPTGWGSLEHRTEMEFSFLYDGIHVLGGVKTDGSRSGTISVTKIKTRNDGRLEINFATVGHFRGLFVLQHHTLPGRKSAILAPEGLNVNFNLENVWTENKFDSPRQQWRAVSVYSKKDYSGEYELQLLPCTVSSTAKWRPTRNGQEVACTASLPKKFKLSITFQQTTRPVPLIYTLDTEFYLCNNEEFFLMDPKKAKKGELDYKGHFARGQTLFGRVLWSSDQDLKSAYKLQIEKVYLCTGRDGYIPQYDPDGTLYGKGKQYGCVQASKNLQHRFLLLDRSSRDAENKHFNEVPFNANFASDLAKYETLADLPGVDGFAVQIDALYKVQAGHQWFLQVMYVIGPEDLIPSRRRRSVSTFALTRHKRAINSESSYKNGTDMRGIEVMPEEGVPASLIILAVLGTIIPMFICIFFAVCFLRRRRRKKKCDDPKAVRHIVVADRRDELLKKCSDDDNADDEFAESWPLSGEKEHKRSSSSGFVTVVTVKTPKIEKNYRRDVNINDVELQPLSGSNEINNAKSRHFAGKTSRKKKNIPIVENLRMNNEEDGTEV